jgi:hypothetical protein
MDTDRHRQTQTDSKNTHLAASVCLRLSVCVCVQGCVGSLFFLGLLVRKWLSRTRHQQKAHIHTHTQTHTHTPEIVVVIPPCRLRPWVYEGGRREGGTVKGSTAEFFLPSTFLPSPHVEVRARKTNKTNSAALDVGSEEQKERKKPIVPP